MLFFEILEICVIREICLPRSSDVCQSAVQTSHNTYLMILFTVRGTVPHGQKSRRAENILPLQYREKDSTRKDFSRTWSSQLIGLAKCMRMMRTEYFSSTLAERGPRGEAKNSINPPQIAIIYYFLLMPKSPAKKTKQLPARILTPTGKRAFRRTLYAYFAEHGRDLPWRNTSNPYHIVVSEIMLQQTQVDRVIARFETFIATFPTFEALDAAQLADVYAVWQGLGYNRRALALKRIAALVVHEHNGIVPQSMDILATFPGIGRATAASICAYAFNMPAVYVETNIRSVFIHLFFNDRLQVDDAEISALVEQTLDRAHPAKWYSALMDYGTMLKKVHHNPSRRSKTHSVQSPFKGSRRQVRGAIMRLVSAQPGLTALQLSKHISNSSTDIITAIAQSLCTEGMLSQTGKRYFIA